MAFMYPAATSVSDCPGVGSPTSWRASASSGGGVVVTGLTDTTLPVWGTPAWQAARPSRAASTAVGRRRRTRRLPTDGDLRDGCRLGLRLGRQAVLRLGLGIDRRQGDGE